MKVTMKADGTYTVGNEVTSGGATVIHVIGTMSTASIEVGFIDRGTFYKLPSTETYTTEISLRLYFGAGVQPAIRVIGADGSTDLNFFLLEG